MRALICSDDAANLSSLVLAIRGSFDPIQWTASRQEPGTDAAAMTAGLESPHRKGFADGCLWISAVRSVSDAAWLTFH
jgi:hypothetical protein